MTEYLAKPGNATEKQSVWVGKCYTAGLINRKPRRPRIAFHSFDLDFSLKGAKLTGHVRLFQRSNGRWYVRFTLNGKRFFLSTGERDQTKALLKTSELIKTAETRHSGVKQVKTFADLAEVYRPFAALNKGAYTVLKEKNKMKFVLTAFGKMELAKITSLDIERYLANRRKKVEPATVNRDLALLKHMFTKAVEWGYLKENPAKTVKLLKEPAGRIRYLSDTERERLLDSCSGTLKAIVLTALLTGMRKGEIQRLTWDDVNLEEGLITLVKTKNNEMRIIPIANELLPVLHGLRDEKPYAQYVFSKKDGSAYGNWRKAFEQACRNAGIKDFRFHDLRHTFASYLAMEDANVFTIQALTGHKTLAMVQRYTHISRPHLKAAVDKLGAKVVHHSGSSLGASVSDANT